MKLEALPSLHISTYEITAHTVDQHIGLQSVVLYHVIRIYTFSEIQLTRGEL